MEFYISKESTLGNPRDTLFLAPHPNLSAWRDNDDHSRSFLVPRMRFETQTGGASFDGQLQTISKANTSSAEGLTAHTSAAPPDQKTMAAILAPAVRSFNSVNAVEWSKADLLGAMAAIYGIDPASIKTTRKTQDTLWKASGEDSQSQDVLAAYIGRRIECSDKLVLHNLLVFSDDGKCRHSYAYEYPDGEVLAAKDAEVRNKVKSDFAEWEAAGRSSPGCPRESRRSPCPASVGDMSQPHYRRSPHTLTV